MIAEASAVGRDAIISCSVGDQEFAIRNSCIRAIARAEQVQRSAQVADSIVGTLPVFGRDVPVATLSSALALDGSSASTGRYIVVVERSGALVGWMVDRIGRRMGDEPAKLFALPGVFGERAGRWFDAVVVSARGAMLLLADGCPSQPCAAPALPWPAEAAGQVVLFSSPMLPAWEIDRYALNATRLVAVTRSMATIRVPLAAPHVAALATWQDTVVPIIDVSGHDGSSTTERSRLLVIRCHAGGTPGLAAFSVSADIDLHRATGADRCLPSRSPLPPFVSGVFTIDGQPVALLDVDALVNGA